MARIKLGYIGGGSSRAPGTVASIIAQGQNFPGSEVVLIDLNPERLAIVKAIADRLARAQGMDLTVTTTTDRRTGLQDCDAVLSSFRPGGFEARVLDERIPLSHGVIGQETQGPGGFFMALRSIHVLKAVVEEMEQVCPRAVLLNYTNPVNIVAEAITHHSAIPTISLCEGPYYFPRDVARAVGLEPKRLDSTMIGLNHGCWSVRHLYDGQDFMPVLRQAYERRVEDGADPEALRMVELALAMDSIPAEYFQYYYYEQEVLAALQAKPTTRAEDIMARVPDYWAHYRQQAESDAPTLDPTLSRGGLLELELAIDVLDAIVNDRREVWPVNVPNRGAIADLPDDMVVEVPGFVDRSGVTPLAQGHLPRQVSGLVKHLGEYQALTAEAAWHGTRHQAVQALASNPLVHSFHTAETLYDEMSAALRQYLPDRLLH